MVPDATTPDGTAATPVAELPPPSGGNVPHRHWRTSDVVMALTVASFTFAVVNVPLLPVSPQVVLPFVLLAVCGPRARATLAGAWRRVEVKLFVLLFGYLVVSTIALNGLQYESVAEAGRLLAAGLCVVALVVYVGESPVRMARLARVFLACMMVSLVWFLLEISLVEPFVSIRASWYADIYAAERERPDGINIDGIRTGIVPFPHDLGYVLAAAVPLLCLSVLSRRTGPVRLASMWGLLISLLALQFAAQRAALLGAACSLLVIVSVFRQYRRRILMGLMALAVIGVIGVVVTSSSFWTTDTLQPSVVDKLRDPRYYADAAFRVLLQAQALRLIFRYPLGLASAGVNWDDLGFFAVFSLVNDIGVIDRVVAVHNSYLGPALNRGLPFFLLTISFLVALFVRARSLVRWTRSVEDPGLRRLMLGPPAVALGLFGIQSMAHNGGILTGQQICALVLAQLFAADRLRAAADRQGEG